MPAQRIVAVGLLTEQDLGLLGYAFDRMWPVEEAPHFFEMLQAIDEADRELWRARDADAANTLAQNDEPLINTQRLLGPLTN